jgi:hypothetical protein
VLGGRERAHPNFGEVVGTGEANKGTESSSAAPDATKDSSTRLTTPSARSICVSGYPSLTKLTQPFRPVFLPLLRVESCDARRWKFGGRLAQLRVNPTHSIVAGPREIACYLLFTPSMLGRGRLAHPTDRFARRAIDMASNFTDADWEWPPALRVFCEQPDSIIPGVAEFFNAASALFVIAAGLVPMLTSPFVDELTDLASAACAINGLFSLLVHAFPNRFFGTVDHISILLMNLLYLKTLLITQYPVLLRSRIKCVPPLPRVSRFGLGYACTLAHVLLPRRRAGTQSSAWPSFWSCWSASPGPSTTFQRRWRQWTPSS